jgi:hypothetical protein
LANEVFIAWLVRDFRRYTVGWQAKSLELLGE